MTVEQKAKAYDKALEIAKAWCKLDNNDLSNEDLETLFPELKESEDERIRKEIINYIKTGTYHKDWIAWLEKQGEQISTNSAKTCKDEPFDYENANIQQKDFAPKAEPKFKVGDWVVQKGLGTYKIVEICESWYEVISYKDGIQYSIGFDKENDCHLWTIKDAKDGDIISYDDGWTCIFKNIHGIWYSSYCFITDDGEFHTGYERHAVDAKINGNAHPATKEQRDLLFKKMKEACYEWGMLKRKINNYGKNKSF